jgi:hypothetical protein
MELSREQHERLASLLDGEAGGGDSSWPPSADGQGLSEEEQAVLREIRVGEASLNAALGEPAVPPQAMARAMRRMRAALAARPAGEAAPARRVRGPFVGIAAAGAAVAAAILLIGIVHRAVIPTKTESPVAGTEATFEYMVGVPGGEAIQSLAREVERFEAELAVTQTPLGVDWQIDSVQNEIDSFWDDSLAGQTPQSEV